MKQVLLALFITLFAKASFATCTASYSASFAPSGSSLLRETFTNTSSYGTVSTGYYKIAGINCGDGTGNITVGSSGSYSHNYSATGTYTIKYWISVVDSGSGTVYCTDTTTGSVTVSYPPCGSVLADTVNSGGVVNFGATVPAGTTGMTYFWTFGDGGTGTGSNPSHTYSANGTYTVYCYDTSGTTCTYYNSITVHVTTVPLACSTLHASFASSVSYTTAYFTNTSSHLSPAVNVASWDFGDGHTSTLPNPSHTYASTGTYTVKLIEYWEDSSTHSVYCADSTTNSVTISSLPPNIIAGTIYRDSTFSTSPMPGYFKTWLITYDTLTHIITAVDSTLDTGAYSVPYYFHSVSTGNYLVKTTLTNGPSSGSGFIPTYYTSSTSWSSASYVNYTSGTTTGINIHMQHGTVTSGPGFIGGDVRYGAGKGTAVGDPVVGLEIMVKDASNKLVATAYTDAGGNYSFSNLPTGTYIIYPEAIGYTTTAWTSINITSGAATVNHIDFRKNSNSIKPDPLGINNVNATQTFAVYPNPTSGKITIQWDNSVPGNADVNVTNVTGQNVYKSTIQLDATGHAEVNLSRLQAGVYFMNIKSDNTYYSQKLVIEK